jgi:diacylglycerol kinase
VSLSPQRLVQSFRCALRGIARLVQTQANARIHLLATVVVLGAGVGLHLAAREWLWIALACALVWSAEALNSALEVLADRVSREDDPLIRDAKDLAAAAVVFCALFALVVAGVVFVPHFLAGK